MPSSVRGGRSERASRRGADLGRDVTDGEDDVVAHPLEPAGNNDRHGVAEVDIGRGRGGAVLDDERTPRRPRSLDLLGEHRGRGDQVIRAPLDQGRLLLGERSERPRERLVVVLLSSCSTV